MYLIYSSWSDDPLSCYGGTTRTVHKPLLSMCQLRICLYTYYEHQHEIRIVNVDNIRATTTTTHTCVNILLFSLVSRHRCHHKFPGDIKRFLKGWAGAVGRKVFRAHTSELAPFLLFGLKCVNKSNRRAVKREQETRATLSNCKRGYKQARALIQYFI